MHIHGAFLHIDVGAPDLVQQLAAGIGALGVGHEKLQQTELGGPHFHTVVTDQHPLALAIQDQLADLHALVGLADTAAPQQGTHPGNQLPRGKRFGYVVVRADIQPLDDVVFRGLGGQHDHRQVAGGFVALDATQHLQAAAAWQHPVQQHQVGSLVHYQGKGVVDILRLDTAKISDLKGHSEHIANSPLVIDDQHRCFIHGSHSPSSLGVTLLDDEIVTIKLQHPQTG